MPWPSCSGHFTWIKAKAVPGSKGLFSFVCWCFMYSSFPFVKKISCSFSRLKIALVVTAMTRASLGSFWRGEAREQSRGLATNIGQEGKLRWRKPERTFVSLLYICNSSPLKATLFAFKTISLLYVLATSPYMNWLGHSIHHLRPFFMSPFHKKSGGWYPACAMLSPGRFPWHHLNLSLGARLKTSLLTLAPLCVLS